MTGDSVPLLWVDDPNGNPSGWPSVIKGITLHQPWPTLILSGHKRWETRSRPIRYTGPVMLHAAATDRTWWEIWDEGHRVNYTDAAAIVQALAPLELDIADDEPVPFGRVVGSMALTECVPILKAGPVTKAEAAGVRRTGAVVRSAPGQPDRLAYYRPGIRRDEKSVDISDQLPFGIWEPGRHAIRLMVVEPAETRCPVCWRTGNLAGRLYNTGPGWNADEGIHCCPVCSGLGHCQPFRLRGNQATPWNWTPKDPNA